MNDAPGQERRMKVNEHATNNSGSDASHLNTAPTNTNNQAKAGKELSKETVTAVGNSDTKDGKPSKTNVSL